MYKVAVIHNLRMKTYVKLINLHINSLITAVQLRFVEIRRLCRGFQSYSDLAPELAVSRDAA